jgi:outer membrane immunogenic protein
LVRHRLSACAIPGSAAELLPTTATQWGGVYVGGQLGGAWSDSDWRYANYNWFDTLGPDLLFTRFGFDGSGVIGGGQAGYNYQSGSWVLGVEASLSGADLDDSYPGPYFPTDHYATKIDWLTTVTGRLGFAQDRWLLYAKAGWAGADIELTLFDTRNAGPRPFRHLGQWLDGGRRRRIRARQELLARH